MNEEGCATLQHVGRGECDEMSVNVDSLGNVDASGSEGTFITPLAKSGHDAKKTSEAVHGSEVVASAGCLRCRQAYDWSAILRDSLLPTFFTGACVSRSQDF